MQERGAGLHRAIGILACTWFVSATLYSALHIELGFDPAYHASVAKNFALGEGWVSSYETTVPFNPDVTTGPTMLLPASAMIALFGNEIWVPAVTAALLQLLVFVLILAALKPLMSGLRQFWVSAALLCAVFLLHAHTWWVTLTADFLVVLLTLLCALLLCRPPRLAGPHTTALAGMALGAALLAKALAWFAVAGLVAYGLWRLAQGGAPRRAAQRAGLLLIGTLAVLLPWEIHKQDTLAGLDEAIRAERQAYATDFFKTQGTGIAELAAAARPLRLIPENLVRNGGLLLAHMRDRYGLPAPATIALLAWLLALTAWRLWHTQGRLQNFMLLIGLIGSGQLVWFLCISASWNAKYALAPVTYSLVLLALALVSRWSTLTVLLPACLLPLLFPPATQAYIERVLLYQGQQTAYTRDQLATLDFLQSLQNPPPLAGCGWVFAPWDFEYLMTGSGHFRDCRRVIAEQLERNDKGSEAWSGQPEFILIASHVFWEFSAYRDLYLPVLRACSDQVLHRNDYFTVAHCQFRADSGVVPLGPQSPFTPEANNSLFVHKPAPIK